MKNKIDVCVCVCFDVMVSTLPLGYEDKVMEGNYFVLLMNTPVCVCGGKSQAFKTRFCNDDL